MKRNNFIVNGHQTVIQCKDIIITIFLNIIICSLLVKILILTSGSIFFNIKYNCFMVKWSYIQGARKVSFKACHLGKLPASMYQPKSHCNKSKNN